jgi:hypothetical protein
MMMTMVSVGENKNVPLLFHCHLYFEVNLGEHYIPGFDTSK